MFKLALGFIAGALFALVLAGSPDPELSGWPAGGIDEAAWQLHEAICRNGQIAVCR